MDLWTSVPVSMHSKSQERILISPANPKTVSAVQQAFIIFQTLQEKISNKSPFNEGVEREQTEAEFSDAEVAKP